MILTIIIFILTILVLVVSHEFGHFIVAKKCGIKVLEFGFGLLPKIISKKVGETIVSLNWLPIGGFVRLLGEDEVDKNILENKRSFPAQPVRERIAVVVAGVVMNFILAVVLFMVVVFAQGFKQEIPLLVPFNFAGVNQTNVTSVMVGDIVPNSPAFNAGIKQGDRVTKINDISVENSEQLIDLTKQNAGQKITLTLLDTEEQIRTVEITPRINPPKGEGAMGVGLSTFTMAVLRYDTFGQKVTSGVTNCYNLSAYSFKILGNLISQSIATKDITPVSESVAGPVGITSLTSTILQTKSPLIPYLNFMALLSLNLAIVNILPFPALDGGRLVFLVFEGITRKRAKPELEKWVNNIGMIILIGLIILVTLSDIKKLLP